jgi:hypothetical protein
MRWFTLAVVLAAAAMFPYSLNRVQCLGYDFPIYWHAGKGDISHDYQRGAFVYNDKVAVAFRPLARLPLPVAFGVFYAATVAGYCALVRRACHGSGVRRALLVAGVIVSGLAMLVVLRCGNVAGLLAFACATPLGSVLAGCCKPCLFAFTVVHAACFCARHSARASGKVPAREGQCGIPADGRGNLE